MVYGVVAYSIFPGSLDTARWILFVNLKLVPMLRSLDGLRYVTMDNLRVHGCGGVAQALAAAGATMLFRPRCAMRPYLHSTSRAHALCPVLHTCVTAGTRPTSRRYIRTPSAAQRGESQRARQVEGAFSVLRGEMLKRTITTPLELYSVVQEILVRDITPARMAGFFAHCYYPTLGHPHRRYK